MMKIKKYDKYEAARFLVFKTCLSPCYRYTATIQKAN